MKKQLRLIMALSIYINISILAQWNQQTSPVTAVSLKDAFFIDSNRGWVVGDWQILRTTDGGTTWTAENSTMNVVNAVFFIDQNTGWAAGNTGNIRKSTDGGVTWMAQSSGTTKDLKDIEFTTDQIGFAVGLDGVILKTTDGGSQWVALSSTVTANFKAITSVGGVLFAGGGQKLMKSTDNGSSWQSVGAFAEIRDVFAFSSNNIFVTETYGQSNHVSKTTDGGTTWQVTTSITTGPFYIYSSHFTSETIGYAVGYSFPLAGVLGIYKTIDGGTTWTGQTTTPAILGGNFYSIVFTDQNTGWIVGDNGMIFKTTNGGVTSVKNNVNAPTDFVLNQNYPNPFNPSTVISFNISTDSYVSLRVIDILGREVATLINNEWKSAGEHEVDFNLNNKNVYIADDLNSSVNSQISTNILFYQLRVGELVATKKMIYLR